MTSTDPVVHYTPDTLEEFFKAKVVTTSTLSVSPYCSLRIDPLNEQIQLHVEADGPVPDLSQFERLEFDVIELVGKEGDWFEFSVDAEGMHYEAYSIIEAVVDGMNDGLSFKASTESALASFKDLLGSRKKMSSEQQAGLVGELLLLESTIDSMGPQAAITGWVGPQNSEHDFVFPNFDAEVKTTKSEARIHVIGSASQLAISQGRPLYLVSIQLTSAGAAADAFSLPEVVERLRIQLAGFESEFDAEIRKVGWRYEDIDLYKTKYVFRSSPRAYLVDDDFPAITNERIAAVIPQADLIREIIYRVDVTKMDPANAPDPIAAFCKRGLTR